MQFLAVLGILFIICMYLRFLQVHNPIIFSICMILLFGFVAMFLTKMANSL